MWGGDQCESTGLFEGGGHQNYKLLQNARILVLNKGNFVFEISLWKINFNSMVYLKEYRFLSSAIFGSMASKSNVM